MNPSADRQPCTGRRASVDFEMAVVFKDVSPSRSVAPPSESQSREREILVKFKLGARVEAIAEAHSQNGSQVKDVIPGIDVPMVSGPAGRLPAPPEVKHEQVVHYNSVVGIMLMQQDRWTVRRWKRRNDPVSMETETRGD